MDREERMKLKIAHDAMMEADKRAHARGLLPAELEIEVEDDDSQYWADFREALRRLRRTDSAH